jgi:hypothetical protein
MNGYKDCIVIIYSSCMFIYFIEQWWMLNMALVLLLCIHDATVQVKPFKRSLTPLPLACCDSCSQNDVSDCYLIISKTLSQYMSLPF